MVGSAQPTADIVGPKVIPRSTTAEVGKSGR